MKPEAKVENTSKRWVEAMGGLAYKFKSPNNNGVMDRIFVFPPFGTVIPCEFKARGKRPTKLQYKKIDDWNTAGGHAIWADSFEMFKTKVKEILDSYEDV